MAGVIRGLLGANSLLVDFFPILCYNKKIPMSERFTTKNGQEIENPTEKMTYEQFRDVVSREYGLSGDSPEARAQQLKELSSKQVFSLMDTLNKSVQGSKDSLEQTDHAMRIGETKTIDVEHRQMVLEGVVGALRNTPDSISAQRVGDVLALTTAMLHPFRDGNGRTARLLGFVFHDEYDTPSEATDDYAALAESRDDARKRGGFTLYGYIPQAPFEGFDQSNPVQVGDYLTGLLTDETLSYTGTFGPAPLYK